MKTIGVIGLGSIGKRHADNLIKIGHVVLGYDPAFPAGNAKDIQNVIDHSEAIVVASPTHLHFEHIKKCLDKPLFVEKPLADRCTDDNGWVDWGDFVDMVGYNLRFHSCVKKAKEWIGQGFLGYPQWANFVCAQYSDKPRYIADGVILNWSHEIDLALYFLGPAEVTASATLLNPHDVLTDIALRHTESGCRSIVHLDYLTRPEIRQSIIVGSDATIIIDIVNRQAWLRLLNGTIADHFEGQDSFEDNYLEEMKAFIDRVNGKQTLGCTGMEAIEVLKICLQVKKQAGLSQ